MLNFDGLQFNIICEVFVGFALILEHLAGIVATCWHFVTPKTSEGGGEKQNQPVTRLF